MTTVVAQDEQPISRTYQYRKVMKPMLERKRRARINHCLDELKELLVGALQAEGESVSRLEKADVLELTVRHLHKLRRVQQLNENSASDRFKAGFITCTNEVSKYMSNLPTSLDLNVTARLLSHLDHCIRQIEAQTASANVNVAHLIPNGPLSSSSSTSTIVLQNQMASQISPLHHHLAAAAAAAAAAASSPASASTLSLNSYNSLSSSSASGCGSSSLSPTLHSSQQQHTRTSPNLNLLTTYTPPTSPISSPLNKLMYHPYAAAHGHHLSTGTTTGGQKSPSPAHIQNLPSHAVAVSSAGQQMPLALCTKPGPRMDRNNNDEEEPFDLSNSMWRPW